MDSLTIGIIAFAGVTFALGWRAINKGTGFQFGKDGVKISSYDPHSGNAVLKIGGKEIPLIDPTTFELAYMRGVQKEVEGFKSSVISQERQFEYAEEKIRGMCLDIQSAYDELLVNMQKFSEEELSQKYKFIKEIMNNLKTDLMNDKIKPSIKRNGFYQDRKLVDGVWVETEHWTLTIADIASEVFSYIQNYIKDKITRDLFLDMNVLLVKAGYGDEKRRDLIQDIYLRAWELQHEIRKKQTEREEEKLKMFKKLKETGRID